MAGASQLRARGEIDGCELELAKVLAGAPEHPAARELRAHLQQLGLSEDQGPDLVAALAVAELAVARQDDERVTPADMDRAVARARTALGLAPHPQVGLFGLTALIDAKASISARVLSTLAADAASTPEKAAALRAAIAHGPGDGALVWHAPKDEIQLVASLIRYLVLGSGASLQLQISNDLGRWLEASQARAGAERHDAMGGAGAFCANLASNFPEVKVHFAGPAHLPRRIAERFTDGVRGLDDHGVEVGLAARIDPAAEVRVNYVAEYPKDLAFTVGGEKALVLDDQLRPLVTAARGRVILGTPSNEDPGFGDLSPAALESIGRAHDLVFLVGPHYFTKGTPEHCRQRAAQLAAQLDAFHAANPALLRHWQYVVPKDPANEPILLEALRGKFDSLSINAVELPGLVAHLRGTLEPRMTREEMESPGAMLDEARELMNALGLARVHVHGRHGDLIITRDDVDPEVVIGAALRARQLGSMKTANPSGEIRGPADIWPIAPVVDGHALAKLQTFADAIQARFGLDAKGRDAVARGWFGHDAEQRRFMFFVPSRSIHESQGGLVSLGDTFDVGTLLFALRPSTSR